jgi:hypothetical protein
MYQHLKQIFLLLPELLTVGTANAESEYLGELGGKEDSGVAEEATGEETWVIGVVPNSSANFKILGDEAEKLYWGL